MSTADMEIRCITFYAILFVAILIGCTLYHFLMSYCEQNNVTKDGNPMFVDIIISLITIVTGTDVAMLAKLISL